MKMKAKAVFTVEAALICPFLCLILCAMIQFTLHLYGMVDSYATKLTEEPVQNLSSGQLIRLEAISEDIF